MRPADREMVEGAGLQFRAIRSGKLRRYFDWKNFYDLFNVVAGYFQARSIIGKFHPDVVFAKGGFVSLPVVWAAGHMGVPVVAHESDIRLGLANALAMKYVHRLATTFPVTEVIRNSRGVARYQHKLVQTGLPLDSGWGEVASPRPFANKKPILMVTGGSQGASFINQVVAQAAARLIQKVNIVHYTGKGDYVSILSYYRSLGDEWRDSWKVVDFDVQNFRSYLKAADVVLARSGSSIFELAYLGKAVIAVPLPGSASDHQAANARYFAASNAVELLEQKDLTVDSLIAKVTTLLDDKDRLSTLQKNIATIGQANIGAAEKIAELVLEAGVST